MAHGKSKTGPGFLSSGKNGIALAARLLRSGEVVAVPTETVYGLAADALNKKAVRKIFAIKRRPLRDPLIVHGADVEFLESLAHFTPVARKLAAAFWPGPLTLVLRKKPAVPKLVTAGRNTVAVRSPAHPVMRKILAACQRPLAAPSANPFGYISPTTPQHVRESLGARAPWIVDGGPCAFGLESTVVELGEEGGAPQILRPGPITAEMLAKVLGEKITAFRTTAKAQNHGRGLRAPGLLARHYSPRTRLRLLAPGKTPPPPRRGQRIAWLQLKARATAKGRRDGMDIFALGKNGDLRIAARELYKLLRRLDSRGYDCLWCELAPPTGLGAALNDRLRRAAAKG